MDALLHWTDTAHADVAIANGDLAPDNSLATAVLISLFSDGRAREDDPIPDGTGDRRGWWPDAWAEDGMGSRLWTLSREKITPDLAPRIEEIARQALQWLIRDGLVRRLDITTERLERDRIGLHVGLELTGESLLRPGQAEGSASYDGLNIDVIIRASNALQTLVHEDMP